MAHEILMNVTPTETRVALVENGVLQELHLERARRRGLVGNIYKGQVVRVLPGMQAAFIEAGLARTAFLHASDIAVPGAEPVVETRNITELLREQQQVLVQVLKDPMGTKGARLTTNITIPSRYLVLLPGHPGVGISARIEDPAERERLKAIGERLLTEDGEHGYILRTAAEGAEEEALFSDQAFLRKLWDSARDRGQQAQPGTLVHEDLPLTLRALRDVVSSEVEKVRVDSRENFVKVQAFCEQFLPELAERVEYYPGERPLFDLYNIEDEIQRALERKVMLKSGGYLIIDQTEAMTTIDVNTGGYVGHRTLEETIFKTNLEAAQAIARQLRLRNLGGIIILDFIDMVDEEHKRLVLRALEKALDKDHAKTQISGVSALGLVEMTRKRTRESLEHILCEPCPTCAGRGSLKTAETVCYEIFREILREARQFEVKRLLVLAAQEVIDLLLDEESASLAQLEEFIGRPIKLQPEPLYTQAQYDVVLM
ncbi:ribonuclease G [Alkalilimnicola sp. S0819]|uniref:ribonuclease G n=1 Tax=Alkalilimnicola sp. S0819 TaxID=2613922 RepID=UPI001261CBE6|nr:ribonuclease G [Alkalilimnicola sp. S0819]KAB7628269.1 ribonuclease G [Alkalilimnicola sp. S0819]MPQ15164.1 ribonuclease G [Alkalilimnicola sp. S0819]